MDRGKLQRANDIVKTIKDIKEFLKASGNLCSINSKTSNGVFTLQLDGRNKDLGRIIHTELAKYIDVLENELDVL